MDLNSTADDENLGLLMAFKRFFSGFKSSNRRHDPHGPIEITPQPSDRLSSQEKRGFRTQPVRRRGPEPPFAVGHVLIRRLRGLITAVWSQI